MIPNLKIDYVVLNAGVLRYPNVIYPTAMHNQTPTLTLTESHRAVRPPLPSPNLPSFGLDHASCVPQPQLSFLLTTWRSSFDEFAFHLHTNTIGPIIAANRLLATNIPIGTIVFMSSDSGSQGNFREMEDGFAAYAASKAALNMAVRHLAAELKRKDDDTIILAMHPGEVETDMANVQLPWEVHGIISPEESVTKMIEVIKSKGIQHSGTFWTYENKVSFMIRVILCREKFTNADIALCLVTIFIAYQVSQSGIGFRKLSAYVYTPF
jgi:NAD(P)-dependent dehydrogenase (short-subunit alcohol dehydrogenase family)